MLILCYIFSCTQVFGQNKLNDKSYIVKSAKEKSITIIAGPNISLELFYTIKKKKNIPEAGSHENNLSVSYNHHDMIFEAEYTCYNSFLWFSNCFRLKCKTDILINKIKI